MFFASQATIVWIIYVFIIRSLVSEGIFSCLPHDNNHENGDGHQISQNSHLGNVMKIMNNNKNFFGVDYDDDDDDNFAIKCELNSFT
jgi:hypothetical protein